jgi:multiple sugar transport system substrate-binding protein
MQLSLKIVLAGSLFFSTPALAVTEVNYWLWDESQLAAYQACADAFEKEHPDIKIKITRVDWYHYWAELNKALVLGTGPDVITEHPIRYPEFAANHLLMDIGPLIARDNPPTNIYFDGLVSAWNRDGKQYGLPKDWGAVAIVYNKAMLAQAGIDPQSLGNLHWNPNDGGSFGKLIAQLSVDTNGRNGLVSGFDPKSPRQYGLLISGLPDGFGILQWSYLAASNGFKFSDGPWAMRFHYNDPKLAETIQWIVDMELQKGFIIPARDARVADIAELFTRQKGALAFVTSWDISFYRQKCKFGIGFAPAPIGPEGNRPILNYGLADSIWVGSKHKEEAWAWAKFLASPQGQKIVGSFGTTLPAIPAAMEIAKQALSKQGIEPSLFDLEAANQNAIFLVPVTDRASEVLSITDAAFDAIFLRGEDVVKTLKAANEKVNSLFY